MKSYLPGLNTVRFFTALSVVLVHATGGMTGLPFLLGPNAVTVFFVLSGYLITYRLLLEQQETGTINLKAFYIRRELRILPLYYLVAVFGGFVLPLFGLSSPSTTAMMSILLLAPQLVHAFGMPPGVLVPLWSIGVEELFYLFFPVAVRRFSLAQVCIAVIVASTVISAIAFTWQSPLLPLARDMRFECMAVGALAAWMIVHRSRWLAVVYHRAVEGMAIALFLVMSLFPVPLPFYDLSFSIIIAVFLVNISTNPRPLLRLEWWWSKAAGDLSYSLYLWHFPIQAIFWSSMAGVPLLMATLFTTLIVAWLSYHFIERPIMNLKDRFRPEPARAVVHG